MKLWLARWAHSKWPLLLIVLLGVGQLWYSQTPASEGRSLYIRTNPQGAQVFKSAPELFLAQDASISGGTKATQLGLTPGPLNVFVEELPLTLVFKKDGYQPAERHFTRESFAGSNLYPQVLNLKSSHPLAPLREMLSSFPFLSLMAPLLALTLLGKVLGRSLTAELEQEQRKILQGVIKAGTQVGEYQVQERVGVGGMAQVFRVTKPPSTENLALKLLDAGVRNEQESEAFLAEVRATAKVTHPGLLFLHDWGEYASRYYMVTEFLQGETLKDRLQRETLSASQVVKLGRELIEVLELVHRAKLVHRDIKPSNVFLTENGRVKLMDFGVAAASGDSDRRSGTLGYAPPEQLEGRRVDGRADLYALGVTLIECLTGQALFQGSTAFQIAEEQASFQLEDLNLDLPENLSELLNRMVNVELETRPANAALVRSALDSL